MSIVHDDWHPARQAVIRAIETAANNHPRSRQTAIGPSEIGHPCPRRIGYTLAAVPKRTQTVAWRPIVGTAVHAWLEEALNQWDTNLVTLGLAVTDEQLHWQVETRTTVGKLGDNIIAGNLDAYHQPSRTIIDHKIMGPSSLRAKKASGPGDQYRAQLHLYALGLTMAGTPVDTVAINGLPSCGELHDAWWWSEPFDPVIAQAAWFRLQAIHDQVVAHGVDALPALEPVDSWCHNCPWFTPRATDPRTGCPGAATPTQGEFADLLGPQSTQEKRKSA